MDSPIQPSLPGWEKHKLSIEAFLAARGKKPRWLSDGSHSPTYLGWLCAPDRVRARQRHEVLTNQRYRCWECGRRLNTWRFDLHHPRGYANLRYEEASDLVAVDRTCHRNIHERLAEQRQRAASLRAVA